MSIDTPTPRSDRWTRARDIADRIRELDMKERESALSAACGTDPTLRRNVEILLRGAPPNARDLDPFDPAFENPAEDRSGTRHSSDAHDADDEFRTREFERRYEIKDQLGAGGMGEVFVVFDRDLRRELAIKFLKPSEVTASPEAQQQNRARFIEEGQVSAQLEHPSIIPIHDLGIDPKRRVYFTMKQVRGSTLREAIHAHHSKDHGWPLSRLLEVVIRIGEAITYAHSKRVIHRDLKPTNIMVGKFGEAYVLDWGLARILDDERPDDPNLERSPEPESAVLSTKRGDTRRLDPSSHEMTGTYQTLGTPQYMAPEQARREANANARALDIYSLGAILYEILVGKSPYAELGSLPLLKLLDVVREIPPRPIALVAPLTPPELEAIASKAMHRLPEQRYATMEEFVADLRAYLDNRRVKAHPSGPFTELRLWFIRNRTVALSLVAIVLVSMLGAIGFAVQRGQRIEMLTRLVDAERITRLEKESNRFALLDLVEPKAFETWLAEARSLAAKRDPYVSRLHTLLAHEQAKNAARHAATPEWRAATDELAYLAVRSEECGRALDAPKIELKDPAERAHLLSEIRRLVGEVEVRSRERVRELRSQIDLLGWQFDDPEIGGEFAQIVALVQAIDRLTSKPAGAIERVERLRRSHSGLDIQELEAAWERAIQDIGDINNPAYGGMRLSRQRGLMPLGRNQSTGLHEFWVMATGERPKPRGDGWEIRAETGLVLVLVPGGIAHLGAQVKDPSQPSYYPQSNSYETPTAEHELGPYFLSRYELTQAQWERMTGTTPSRSQPGMNNSRSVIDWTHPVEQVSFATAEQQLSSWNLQLPTEAEWEYAARAGALSVFPVGSDPESQKPFANYLDESANAAKSGNDGFQATAPVDAKPPNPWGFHLMAGNVWELSEDAFNLDPTQIDSSTPRAKRIVSSVPERTARGGSYQSSIDKTRWTIRRSVTPSTEALDIGMRPGRAIDP